MWALSNQTPYGAERAWTRGVDGKHVWLVAVRATFDVARSGRLELAEAQSPPALSPRWGGEPGASSLWEDTDFALPKPTTDVVVHGAACAPQGTAELVRTRVVVGSIDKQLLVTGRRIWLERGGRLEPSRAEPFERLPIRWEDAFGGLNTASGRADMRNPVGVGFARPRAGAPLPRIVRVGELAAPKTPVGYGPIAPHWSPRLQRFGTYREKWVETKKPLLPDDYDPRASHCAPDDQITKKPLIGGESMTVENVGHAGVTHFVLPRIHLVFTTRIGAVRIEARPRLATVAYYADVGRLVLTWGAGLEAERRRVALLDTTTIVEKRVV